ncbi:MAG: class I SAM-dependent methyltransferase [Candidatus Limnocylindrales bacterium]
MSNDERDLALVRRYEDLIRTGVYRSSTEHGSSDKAIVAAVLRPILESHAGLPIRVLDCGCGPGEWLEEIGNLTASSSEATQRFGFDITPGMIDLARSRLKPEVAPDHLCVGDIINPTTYAPQVEDGFDLVYAFDVVQQLPKRSQWTAVEAMLSVVRRGGSLVIFDHDGRSSYGRSMRLKKLLRRHLGIPLVPNWYVYSSYPPVAQFAARLAARPDLGTEVIGHPDTPRRALVVHRAPGPP